MRSSRRAKRWVSTDTHELSTGSNRMVAFTTIPVRPIPPAVAQKRSGSFSGETSCTPVGVTSVIDVTCRQKLPSR
jgi:hypothetical protein